MEGNDDVYADVPSSPPAFITLHGVGSPTSSEPPIFSSDGPIQDADLENYSKSRQKRKFHGSWWDDEGNEVDDATPRKRRQYRCYGLGSQTPYTVVKKKAKFSRNFDSGVFMGAADEDEEEPKTATLSEEDAVSMAAAKRLDDEIANSSEMYDLSRLGLEDQHLHVLARLSPVVKTVPDPGNEVPDEKGYRSMVPKIYLNLGRNSLQHLSPQIFNVEHITSLNLSHNRIIELPHSISKLVNLRELNLSHNQISYLPPSFNSLFRTGFTTTRLSLFANPIHHHVLEQNWVIDYDERDYEANFHKDPFCIRLKEIANSAQRSPRSLGQHLVAHSPVAWYNDMGGLEARSIEPHEAIQGKTWVFRCQRGDILIGRDDVWATPTSAKGKPTLFDLCVRVILDQGAAAQLQELLDDYPLPRLQYSLDQIRYTQKVDGVPFRICATCAKKFVVVRAAWVELRTTDEALGAWNSALPFIYRVCSWDCVPEHIVKRPEGIRT